MSVNTLFYVVFLSQILLISVYYPRKMLARVNRVLTEYPESQYPKMYPVSMATMQGRWKIYKIVNIVLALIGFALLAHAVYVGRSSNVAHVYSDAVPFLYGFMQYAPLVLVEVFGFKNLRLMRKLDTRTQREANLKPRRLGEVISPALLNSVAIIFLVYVCIEFYLGLNVTHSSIQDWDFDKIFRMSTFTLCNIMFLGMVFAMSSVKRCDPYQSDKDRTKAIRFSVSSVLWVAIVANVFFIANSLIHDFDLDSYDIVVNSIYIQLIAVVSTGLMLTSLRLEDIDFEVYKKGSTEL